MTGTQTDDAGAPAPERRRSASVVVAGAMVVGCAIGGAPDRGEAGGGIAVTVGEASTGVVEPDATGGASDGGSDEGAATGGGEPKFDIGGADDLTGGGGAMSGCAKIDFLFVVDNSGSMDDEQAALAVALPRRRASKTERARKSAATRPATRIATLGCTSPSRVRTRWSGHDARGGRGWSRSAARRCVHVRALRWRSPWLARVRPRRGAVRQRRSSASQSSLRRRRWARCPASRGPRGARGSGADGTVARPARRRQRSAARAPCPRHSCSSVHA